MKKKCTSGFPNGILTALAVIVLGVTSPCNASLVGHWTFDDGSLVDSTGNFGDLVIEGDAAIADGALDLNGSGTTSTGWAHAPALPTSAPIGSKTLVSWITLQSLSDAAIAGAAMSIDLQSGDRFDGIVFAERNANRWMNGSSGFQRSPAEQFDQTAVSEETGTGALIQLAVSYEDLGGGNVQITGYRDGELMGTYATGSFASWAAGEYEVLFGPRHTNPNPNGALDALVHEARLYDEALTGEQIAALTLTSAVDSDGDGLDDDWEQAVIDSDPGDAIVTLADVNPGDDLDGDNLTNLQEFTFPRTDPLDPDSDDDNLTDDVETNTKTFVDAGDTGTNPNKPDTDDDGLRDDVETNTGNYVSATNTGTDPNNPDSDGDRLTDGEEIADPFSDPNDPDDPPPPPFEDSLIGHWTFEPGAELVDLTGNFSDLVIEGDAQVIDGALDINGSGTTSSGWAHASALPTSSAIESKTLVSWITLQSLSDVAVAGAPVSVDLTNGDRFDGIVFAERDANRWMNGSSNFFRSPPGQFDQTAVSVETTVGEPIQLAITYEDLGGGNVQITGYRNALQMGTYSSGAFATWASGEYEALFGPRHTNPNPNGALDALIDEARIYSVAATPAQILALFNAGPGAGEALRFTGIVYDEGTREATATWVSKEGKTYRIEWSGDMQFWVEEDDSYPSGGATSDRTSFTYSIPPGTARRYFRVTEE